MLSIHVKQPFQAFCAGPGHTEECYTTCQHAWTAHRLLCLSLSLSSLSLSLSLSFYLSLSLFSISLSPFSSLLFLPPPSSSRAPAPHSTPPPRGPLPVEANQQVFLLPEHRPEPSRLAGPPFSREPLSLPQLFSLVLSVPLPVALSLPILPSQYLPSPWVVSHEAIRLRSSSWREDWLQFSTLGFRWPPFCGAWL